MGPGLSQVYPLGPRSIRSGPGLSHDLRGINSSPSLSACAQVYPRFIHSGPGPSQVRPRYIHLGPGTSAWAQVYPLGARLVTRPRSVPSLSAWAQVVYPRSIHSGPGLSQVYPFGPKSTRLGPGLSQVYPFGPMSIPGLSTWA
jgi:hypothetical protein